MLRTGWDSGFAARFDARADELKRVYNALYHDDFGAWEAFVGILAAAHRARPEPLKALDARREAYPDWYRARETTALQCVDVEIRSTSDAHEWAKRAREGDRAARRKYFFYDSWDLPNAYEQTLRASFPDVDSHFTWCPEADALVMTTGGRGAWDVNFANPAALNGVVESLLNLANRGADALRLHGLSTVWKALGTPCRGLPESHRIARILRLAFEIACPGVALMSGAGADYFGTPDAPECHYIEDTTLAPAIWHTVATKDAALLSHALGSRFARSTPGAFVNALNAPRGIEWTLDDAFLAARGMEKAPHRAFLNDYLTGNYPGSPCRGELIDGRVVGETAALCGDGRLLETLHALIFTLSGVPVVDGEAAARLVELREAHRAFDADAEAWVMDARNPGVLGIGRYHRGEKLLALFNFTDQPQVSALGDTDVCVDLATGLPAQAVRVEIPSYGFVWLSKDYLG